MGAKRRGRLRVNTMQNNYISFTAEINAIDCLEKVRYFLDLTKQSPINWKWVILTLHGALYGFAICALAGIHDEQVYKKRKWKCQKRELITLGEALCKCKNSEIMCGYVDSQPLRLTKSQGKSINRMQKELRNNFEHFIPKTWVISTNFLPHISNDVLDVVYFLAVDTQANIHVLKEKQKIAELIYDCKKIMETQSHSAAPCLPAHPQWRG